MNSLACFIAVLTIALSSGLPRQQIEPISYRPSGYDQYTPSQDTNQGQGYPQGGPVDVQDRDPIDSQQPTYPDYQKPVYPDYQKPSYPDYQKPSYPDYQKPSYPDYQKPSYPDYHKPSYPDYHQPQQPQQPQQPHYPLPPSQQSPPPPPPVYDHNDKYDSHHSHNYDYQRYYKLDTCEYRFILDMVQCHESIVIQKGEGQGHGSEKHEDNYNNNDYNNDYNNEYHNGYDNDHDNSKAGFDLPNPDFPSAGYIPYKPNYANYLRNYYKSAYESRSRYNQHQGEYKLYRNEYERPDYSPRYVSHPSPFPLRNPYRLPSR
ncbi:transcription factor mef2A-like [Aplysia californica]|uniref:Transcription factor mef2A-like n=1 Tax=Aplysia californica TaxID=6500 RepID=A0ABM1A1J3_APLCA|nr:transcription factor mef2A-like [Aplysia californica]